MPSCVSGYNFVAGAGDDKKCERYENTTESPQASVFIWSFFFLPSVQSTVSSVSPGMVRSLNVSNCFIVHIRRCQASCPPLLIPPATPRCFYLSAQPSCTHSFLLNPRHPLAILFVLFFFFFSKRSASSCWEVVVPLAGFVTWELDKVDDVLSRGWA